MDYGTYRGILTLVLLILFIGLVISVYRKKRKKEFEDIAKSILDDDELKDSQESNKND